jgi:rhodanese-related sulfurtransferase
VSKRYGDAALDEVLCDTLRKALIAIAAIEADASTGLRFEIDRVEVQLLDRLVAPNTETAFAEARAELQKVAQRLHGEGATLSRAYEDDSRHTLSAVLQSSEPADLETLIEGLGGRKAITSPAAKQVEWAISVEALKKLRDQDSEHILVDVREAKEYEICNLGGKLIPLDTLGSRLGELDPESHIIVHCKLGGRGAKAVTLLREAGFENAWYLKGGIIAWIDRVDSSLKRY